MKNQLLLSLLTLVFCSYGNAQAGTPKQCRDAINSASASIQSFVAQIAKQTKDPNLVAYVKSGNVSKRDLLPKTTEVLMMNVSQLKTMATSCGATCKGNKNGELDKICRDAQGMTAFSFGGNNLQKFIEGYGGVDGLKRKVQAAFNNLKAEPLRNYLPPGVPNGLEDEGTVSI